jgi:hypothetical protein
MPLPAAWSSAAAAMAADCTTSAILPRPAITGATLALRRPDGTTRPPLPGPSTRTSLGRAASRMALRAAATWASPSASRAATARRSRRACFDDALLRARSQAENYARALPAGEGRPPFLVVVDVGNVIELYAEFSRSGATYLPFPDPRSHRIRLADLRDEAIRKRLKAAVWLDPLSLDPTRQPPASRARSPATSPRWPSCWKKPAMRRRPSPASSPAACSACSPRMSA